MAASPVKIPLIRADLPSLEEVEGEFREILSNGKITNFGKYVTQFESEVSAFLKTPTLTVSSGTMALFFTLQAFGVEPGQEVLLPSFTFMATAQAVLLAGAVPVFCEVLEDLTVSPEDLASQLEAHPKASTVIGVHTYGLPCQVEAIRGVVEQAGKKRGKPIHLLYDAAHAFGSMKEGKPAGSFGDAEVFSLSVTKALVSVEGGLVCSQKKEILDKIRKMRNYGIESSYNAAFRGMNGKMSEFHAVIGLHNLKRLPEILRIRAEKAASLTKEIHQKTSFRTIPVPPGVRHTFKDFTIVVPPALKPKRDAIIQFLDREGVETRPYFYPPVHEQKLFARFADRALPVTEDLARRVITLPFYTAISQEEMDRMVGALQKSERSVG